MEIIKRTQKRETMRNEKEGRLRKGRRVEGVCKHHLRNYLCLPNPWCSLSTTCLSASGAIYSYEWRNDWEKIKLT